MKRFASLICGLFACFCAAGAPLELARPALVVPEGALPCVRFAAEELAEFMSQAVGAKIPVVAAPSGTKCGFFITWTRTGALRWFSRARK